MNSSDVNVGVHSCGANLLMGSEELGVNPVLQVLQFFVRNVLPLSQRKGKWGRDDAELFFWGWGAAGNTFGEQHGRSGAAGAWRSCGSVNCRGTPEGGFLKGNYTSGGLRCGA